MTRSRRILKIAKWPLAVLALLSVAVWITAANWMVIVGSSPLFVLINNGCIVVRADAVDGVMIAKWTGFNAWFVRPWDWKSIPAWWLPAIALPLTVALFAVDRRHARPGHCRCGYDLTGNMSGRCPECGTETQGARA